MPITEDIRDHEVLGRDLKEAMIRLLLFFIRMRFGPLPSWAGERLEQMRFRELDAVHERIGEARSLEELLS